MSATVSRGARLGDGGSRLVPHLQARLDRAIAAHGFAGAARKLGLTIPVVQRLSRGGWATPPTVAVAETKIGAAPLDAAELAQLLVDAMAAWRADQATLYEGAYYVQTRGGPVRAPWSDAAAQWFGGDTTERLHRAALIAFPDPPLALPRMFRGLPGAAAASAGAGA